MTYKLTGGDHNVVRNLRAEYPDGQLDIYSDETIAKAWRDFSLSDEYERHKSEPTLFLEWVEMEHGS